MSRTGDADWLAAFANAAGEAAAAGAIEEALAALARLAHDRLGDPAAAGRPGALKPGERDYRVAGTFLITPDRAYNMLVGNVGFPPEQRRLMIPLGWNHPGWVVANRRALLLANTDEHETFRQFLKTSRMGSSIYVPILIGGEMVGQIVAAAQARETYDQNDLERLEGLSALAGLAWRAFDGASWLRRDYPAPDAWRAEQAETGAAQ